MTAALLSIGTELTRGELVNTNAAWLAERLTELGFEVGAIETIADDRAVIVETLRRLAARHRVIISTGGLGPTTDDFTAECAAAAAGVAMVRDERSLEAIRQRLARFGRTLSASNAKQADVPAGSDVLDNPVGTAPGFRVALGGAQLFFAPGVPSEMKRMFEEQIAPRIAPLAGHDTAQNHLKTFGLPESQVGDLLDGVEAAFPGVTIGYRAHFPEIEVKVFARAAAHPGLEGASRRAEAQALADAATREVQRRLGPVVYAEGRDETMPTAVARALRNRGWTLALAESCTGGLVGSMLTALPGASEFLLLDAVVYANAMKTAVLGVDPELLRGHGAVSAESATAMAQGARRVAGSDLAVAITGIAGPGGGTEQKPVGLVYLAVASADGVRVEERRFPGDRARVQGLAAWTAMRLLLDAAR
jgi:nicotinamide-nucleotide amidase